MNISNYKEDILIHFGQKVRDFRTKMNLSQEQLAEKAMLHRTYIGMIERGEKNITILNIYKISKALDIEVTELFK
jgi:transcriptional regulator with XRE-family HTH domain